MKLNISSAGLAASADVHVRGRCSSFSRAARAGVNMYFMSGRNAPAGIAVGLIKCSALSLRLITQADELIPDDSVSRLQPAI